MDLDFLCVIFFNIVRFSLKSIAQIIRPFNLHLDFWKSKSVSNLRKISGPANLNKMLDLYHKPEKNPGDKLKKNPGV